MDVAKENSIKLAGSKEKKLIPRRLGVLENCYFLNQEWKIKLSLFEYIPARALLEIVPGNGKQVEK